MHVRGSAGIHVQEDRSWSESADQTQNLPGLAVRQHDECARARVQPMGRVVCHLGQTSWSGHFSGQLNQHQAAGGGFSTRSGGFVSA